MGAAVDLLNVAPPDGPLYSLLLVAHVALATVGFGSIVSSGIEASRARRGPHSPSAPAVVRYFRPGPNIAGRTLYGVPVLGAALIAASRGAWSAGDGFVVAGLALWTAATVIAEATVWRLERRISSVVRLDWDGAGEAFDRQCRVVTASAYLLGAVFVAAVVLMVAKP